MKERTTYLLHMTEDDIKNIKVAADFIKNAFVTHLRHTTSHEAVMSVMGTFGHMIEELDLQIEYNDYDKILEQVNKLLKEVQNDD